MLEARVSERRGPDLRILAGASLKPATVREAETSQSPPSRASELARSRKLQAGRQSENSERKAKCPENRHHGTA